MRNFGLLSLLFFVICSSSFAQELSGPLNGTLGPGTYTVVGDISVEAGDSLIINPGTVFLFSGAYEFDIYGYFSAVGNETDSIKFMPEVPGSGWGGVDFYDSSDDSSRLGYCLITGSSASGVDCFSSGPTISNCTISGNSANFGGGIYCTSASPTITNCTISGNSTNVCGAGIWASSSEPTITNCTISGNSAGGSAGGIYCYSSNAIISNCTISDNSSTSGGGGIFCRYVSPTISHCTISGNSTPDVGGGICINSSSPTISHCTISGNSTDYCGGGIEIYISTPTIINCTVSGNSAAYLGGGIESFDSSPVIVNTIVEGNIGGGGIYFFNSLDAEVSYGDYFGNEGGSFTGAPPQGLGQIVTVNVNGDSCDQYFNILLDPLFYSTSGDSAFYLTANSPCIDAGDPSSPLDPDSTIADMGAFYFDQGGSMPVSITLTPYSPPVQIPSAGGSFDFNVAIANSGAASLTFDVWIMVELPSGSWIGPVLGPASITLSGGQHLDRDRIQNVPGSAPAGVYLYEGRVGTYPDDIWDSDGFPFEKLATGDGPSVSDWMNSGEGFDAWLTAEVVQLPTDFSLLDAYPNPFNATVTLSFALPRATKVLLAICDIRGCTVATLVNGWRDAGSHEVIFNASGLASGVYIYRLSAGGFIGSGKMALIK